MRRLFSFAEARAGRSNPARMAMMAMTTSSSINVKAPDRMEREGPTAGRTIPRNPFIGVAYLSTSRRGNQTVPSTPPFRRVHDRKIGLRQFRLALAGHASIGLKAAQPLFATRSPLAQPCDIGIRPKKGLLPHGQERNRVPPFFQLGVTVSEGKRAGPIVRTPGGRI